MVVLCFILFQLFSVNFLSVLLVKKEIPINSLDDLVKLDVNVLVVKDTCDYIKMKNESWSIISKVEIIDKDRDYKRFDISKNILMTDTLMSKAIKQINHDVNLKITEGNGSFTLSGFPINKNLDQVMKQKLHFL